MPTQMTIEWRDESTGIVRVSDIQTTGGNETESLAQAYSLFKSQVTILRYL